jgi:Family of unknown function (DUF6302)/ADP-Ribosyltransferase in polyvalent proteins
MSEIVEYLSNCTSDFSDGTNGEPSAPAPFSTGDQTRAGLPDYKTIDRIRKKRDKKLAKPVTEDQNNFKGWFKDSKVVDSAGRPMVVYHSSPARFTVFDTSKGAHFGTAEQAENLKKTGEKETRTFYLSIQNPLRLPDLGVWHNFNNVHANLFRHEIITREEADTIWEAWQQSDGAGWAMLKRTLIQKSYDGVVYANEQEGPGDSYIIFWPEQAKSADKNNGEFSSNSPSVYEAEDRSRPRKRSIKEAEEQPGFAHYRETLINPELVDRAVVFPDPRSEVHNWQHIAVPAGGSRRGGWLECWTKEDAEKAMAQLAGKEGFPNLRVESRLSITGFPFSVHWGEPLPNMMWTSQIGAYLGYKPYEPDTDEERGQLRKFRSNFESRVYRDDAAEGDLPTVRALKTDFPWVACSAKKESRHRTQIEAEKCLVETADDSFGDFEMGDIAGNDPESVIVEAFREAGFEVNISTARTVLSHGSLFVNFWNSKSEDRYAVAVKFNVIAHRIESQLGGTISGGPTHFWEDNLGGNKKWWSCMWWHAPGLTESDDLDIDIGDISGQTPEEVILAAFRDAGIESQIVDSPNGIGASFWGKKIVDGSFSQINEKFESIKEYIISRIGGTITGGPRFNWSFEINKMWWSYMLWHPPDPGITESDDLDIDLGDIASDTPAEVILAAFRDAGIESKIDHTNTIIGVGVGVSFWGKAVVGGSFIQVMEKFESIKEYIISRIGGTIAGGPPFNWNSNSKMWWSYMMWHPPGLTESDDLDIDLGDIVGPVNPGEIILEIFRRAGISATIESTPSHAVVYITFEIPKVGDDDDQNTDDAIVKFKAIKEQIISQLGGVIYGGPGDHWDDLGKSWWSYLIWQDGSNINESELDIDLGDISGRGPEEIIADAFHEAGFEVKIVPSSTKLSMYVDFWGTKVDDDDRQIIEEKFKIIKEQIILQLDGAVLGGPEQYWRYDSDVWLSYMAWHAPEVARLWMGEADDDSLGDSDINLDIDLGDIAGQTPEEVITDVFRETGFSMNITPCFNGTMYVSFWHPKVDDDDRKRVEEKFEAVKNKITSRLGGYIVGGPSNYLKWESFKDAWWSYMTWGADPHILEAEDDPLDDFEMGDISGGPDPARPGIERSYRYGWALTFGNQADIEQYADQMQIELTPELLDEINEWYPVLERNFLKMMNAAGFGMTDEGHDGEDSDLVGSGYFIIDGLAQDSAQWRLLNWVSSRTWFNPLEIAQYSELDVSHQNLYPIGIPATVSRLLRPSFMVFNKKIGNQP